jgi:hypothetical protein
MTMHLQDLQDDADSKYETKNHTAVDIFKYYKKNNPGTDVTYTQFKYIISQFNRKASEYILQGRTLNLHNRLGKIRIKKIRRNFYRKSVDWAETNKLKAQGIKQLVYFTDDYWFRWYWEKRVCTIPNKSVYSFRPTGGDHGNRKNLVKLLKTDEFAHINFKE